MKKECILFYFIEKTLFERFGYISQCKTVKSCVSHRIEIVHDLHLANGSGSEFTTDNIDS